MFFKTHLKCFHTDHFQFNHQIETDGVSCSILLVRIDKVGRKVRAPKTKNGVLEPYIDQLSHTDLGQLANKKVVGIDPNMGDLLFCVDSDQPNQTKFRYTQDTRRKETKVKKYRKLLQEQKDVTIIEGKSVLEWEATMSEFNKKTLKFDEFKVYLWNKNGLNYRLYDFYSQYLFRKLKLGSYCRRQITEARMLTRFKQLFGPPEETVICIGDWAQKKHMKFKEPVKGKGFRTIFRQAGYKVYLVDEYRTSDRCCACDEHGVCTKFRVIQNPRPYRREQNPTILCHGLVKCTTCSRLWNRDVNAASNIWKIATQTINGFSRPAYLQRASQ